MAQSAHRPQSFLLLPDGVFVDPPGEVRRGWAVLTDGDSISAVGPAADLLAGAAQRVPLPGLTLLPGLINTHVHLSLSGGADPRSDYWNDSPEARFARALENGALMLDGGVTTIRDCGSDWHVLKLHEVAEKRLAHLPNLLLSGPPVTPPGGHLHQMGGEAAGSAAITELVTRLHEHGANSIKAMATGGQMTPGTFPERAGYSVEELQAVTAAAAQFGHPTVAHVLATEGIRRAALAGFDSLEHCAFFQRADNQLLQRVYDSSIGELIRQSGAGAMIGVAASYHALDQARARGGTTEAEQFLLTQEENTFSITRKLSALGIPIVCGTDAGTPYTPFNETWLEVNLLVDRVGLTPLEALRSATVNAAAALKLETVTGRAAQGFRADLIAVRGSPLDNPAVLSDVPWVMRRGEITKGAVTA